MESRSDAFVALPGGFGTLEEILTLKQLATHAKPVVFLNARGFFDPLLALFEQLYREQFAKEDTRAQYHVAATAHDALDHIERYLPPATIAKWFQS